MPVSNEKYDQLKIDKLKHYLEDMASKGQPKPYEIFVDSLKVVPKTEDPKDFDSYEYYMNEDTEKLRILIYNSSLSPRNDQYCFYVQQGKQEKGLNGLGEVENIIQEKLAARDREHEVIKMKEELAETKKQLDEAEDYIEELEEKLAVASDNKYKLKNLDLVELGTTVLGRLAEKHADILAGAGLEGFAKKEKELPASQQETAVSFQKKEETVTATLSTQHQQYIDFMTELEKSFDEAQMLNVIQILQHLMEDPSKVETVSALLTNK